MPGYLQNGGGGADAPYGRTDAGGYYDSRGVVNYGQADPNGSGAIAGLDPNHAGNFSPGWENYNTGGYQSTFPGQNTQPQVSGGPVPNGMGAGMAGGGMLGQQSSLGSNPYLGGMADDITRRVNDFTGQQNRGIRSNAILAGGFGGSAQGVAQGNAIQSGQDALTGGLSNLYGGAYNNDQNRGLQRYQGDQQFALGAGGLQNQRYGMDQNFYTQQRGQDQSQMALGANLVQQGLQTPWTPIQNANQSYGNYTGYGNTTTGGDGGGNRWQSAIGTGLGVAQMGTNMGWW